MHTTFDRFILPALAIALIAIGLAIPHLPVLF